MTGTILNIATVLVGTFVGLLIGQRFSDRISSSVVTGLGLITLVVGIENALKTGNIIIVLLATVIGVIVGELLRIDLMLERAAGWIQSRFAPHDENPNTETSSRERFITGFVTASLVFCVGPLTFVGAIQDGMGLPSGFQFLAIKSVLDMFAAMAFATTFGIGVGFTVITIFVVQGGLALIGMFIAAMIVDPTLANDLINNPVIIEMTAVGGVILIGLSLVLLELKQPRIANFLPALIVAPLLVIAAQAIGIPIYPL